jgi:hypothetical protein
LKNSADSQSKQLALGTQHPDQPPWSPNEISRIADTISIEIDWSPWDASRPMTSQQGAAFGSPERSEWVDLAQANNEIQVLGSYKGGKIYRPEGVFTHGYPSFESIMEGGPLIGLNTRALSDAPIEGIGKIQRDDTLDSLGDLLGVDMGRRNSMKKILKTLKRKWRDKVRQGKTVEHEVDHFNDWLQARLLGKDDQPTNVDMAMVKDYAGRPRYIDKDYASLYDKDLVKLSETMIDSYERYKWMINIQEDMTRLNRVRNANTHEWTPSSKTWEELTDRQRRAIRGRSEKNILWSPVELKPRLEELSRVVIKTGVPVEDVLTDIKYHTGGIFDIADGLTYIFERDPSLLPSITPLLERQQTQYPSQFDFNLLKAGSAMATVDQEELRAVPEWQGLINAGTNQITAGKLAAAGMP